MITITRLFARQLRSVLRRARFARPPHGQSNAITFIARPDGLKIRAALSNIAIECRLPGPYEPAQFTVPYTFLAACEGSGEQAVNLNRIPDDKVRVSWSDRGVPMNTVYETCRADDQQVFPELPESFAPADPTLLPALRDAAATASSERTRYALDDIQLRGSTGEIISTDTRHLLVQGGFQFPWTDDILVPGSNVFAAPELSGFEQVELGRTPTHVVLRAGVWTVFLRIDQDVRYPSMKDVIPRADTPGTRCHLESHDAAFLAAAIRRLPGSGEFHAPVTLDLNGHVCVRARGAVDPQVTELVLSRSSTNGEPARMYTDRTYLERMVELGFRELLVPSNNAPCLCQDERRTYIWMPLDRNSALPPSPDCVRIDSAQVPAQEPQPQSHSPVNRISNRSSVMSRSQTNGTATQAAVATPSNGHAVPVPTAAPVNGHAQAAPEARGSSNHPPQEHADQPASDPIHEAESLRQILRHVLVRTNRLVVALRRQKKQARLVQTTLASLRELQGVG